MARETNSIATVWDIDNSNGFRVAYNTSLEDETCCMKSMLSGANAYWRNTIIPTSYSNNNMYVKYGDIKYASVYPNGFSVTYTKSGDASGTLYKWVKISNLKINITGPNGVSLMNSLYTMSAYTSAASIPIPYTVCSGDRVSFVTSAATFSVSNTSGASTGGIGGGLIGGIVITGSVTQSNNITFIITGANATLTPNFILYGIREGVVIPSGTTPTPTGTTYRTVTINLGQSYGTSVYEMETGPLKVVTGNSEAQAIANAKSSTAMSITTKFSNLTLGSGTKLLYNYVISADTFSIPSNAYLCISATTAALYPKFKTSLNGTYSYIGDWYTGTSMSNINAIAYKGNYAIITPSMNSICLVGGVGMGTV